MSGWRRVRAGIAAALRARPGVFAGVGAAVLALDVAVPVLVLSIARTPVDFFTFNPWLGNLPAYLTSGKGSVAERLHRAWELALFWFSADGIFGADWGFAVTIADLARFVLMAALIGAYFALWAHRRGLAAVAGRRTGAGRGAGLVGAAGSVCGLATGGCTVVGCGAPVIPVIGLAFAGLSSTTLTLFHHLSTYATIAVIAGMAAGILYLAWRLGDARLTDLVRAPAPPAQS